MYNDESPTHTTKPKVWTVSELNREVRLLLESCHPYGVWISGEVSNVTIHGSGHVYLTLKDRTGQISGTWFGGATIARQLKLANGVQVEAFGMLSIYEARGQFQVNIKQMKLKGAGSLQQQFDALKLKLQNEGLFDPQRKQPIPAMPKCVGIVTSPTGAALKDFLQIINRRFSNMHIRIYPATVQGTHTGTNVSRGIQYFNHTRTCDVIVVTRGGGSMEDLWGFNDEHLARTIAASTIPVISAVGHEIDFTISDFVADMRVPTPSAAAELVCGKKSEIVERINNLKRRARSALQLPLLHAKRRIERVTHSYVFKEPANLVQIYQQKVDELATRSLQTMRGRTEWHKMKLNQFKSQLQALDPTRVLERGYSILIDESGKALHSASEVTVGQKITGRLSKGHLNLEVKSSGEEK